MSYETIVVDVSQEVATVTLDRPDKMNSLSRTMRLEICDAFSTLPQEARCIVITGAGRGFCAGQDLGDASAVEGEGGLDLERTLREEYEPMLRLIYDCPVPTIAAVNGIAAGAGANLALAADIVIAAQSASFVQAFSRIGLIPDAGGTYWLPRLVGSARALGMCLTSEPVEAARAADWGMIWQVVPDEALAPTVADLALKLASGPTVAHRLAKQALRQSPANDLDAQLALEAKLQGEAGRTRDFMEGVTAFMEKRPARYEGR